MVPCRLCEDEPFGRNAEVLPPKAQELPEVTVAAVRGIVCEQNKYKLIVMIPHYLQKKLLDFAQIEGLGSGPIFQSRDVRPMYGRMCPQ